MVDGALLSKLRAAAVVIVTISTSIGIMCASQTSQAEADSKGLRWIFSGPGVAAIAANSDVSRLLNNQHPFVMRGPAVSDIPPQWQAVTFASFTGLKSIRRALESGNLGPDVKGIMYDYEKWSYTPQEEQRNPALYVKEAADLVHSHGLLFLTAPAVNLVTVIEPGSQEKRYESYIRLGIAADAARYADVYDIQAQGSLRNTDAYANFVRQAAAQARQANANVIVLAGISTQPSGQIVSADDIFNAIQATRGVVDGYWFNIPRPSAYCPRCTDFRPDIAMEVLRRVSGQ